jgi:prolyl-tRNA synthetase
MRLSSYYISTQKENPSDAETKSHKLLIKAGYIQKNEQGLYTIMPIGVRVLKKIQKIIEDGLDSIGAMQIIMPIVQSKDLWVKSGRDNYCGDETLKIFDRKKKEYLFSPTNEEVINDILSVKVKSYKSLPMCFYQINTKFRDEIRPRFGLMRAREFLMMDAYSFHATQTCAHNAYWQYYEIYKAIFKKLGVEVISLQADSGPIGGDLSHEFHIIADTGESKLYLDSEILNENYHLDKSKLFAVTEDKFNENLVQKLEGSLISKRGIEVGHIFYVGADKYSKPMDFKVQNEDQQWIYPEMCTYGIGVTRVMAAIVEAKSEEDKLIWPSSIAPFEYMIINLDPKDEMTTKKCEEIYKISTINNFEVLYDDTDNSFGEKLARADLLGINNKIIIGKKLLNEGRCRVKTNIFDEVVTLVDNIEVLAYGKTKD